MLLDSLPGTPEPPAHPAPSDSPLGRPKFGRRRGATAMEYLFVLSLIFVVAMTGIGYFGQATKEVADAAAAALQKATEGNGSSGP